MAVIFISHKLDEVMAVSRRVAVLRQGRLVAERETAATTPAELAELMVGRKVAMPHAEAVAAAEQAAPVIALSQVTVRDRDGATRLDSLDLTVHRHEIVAIAGVAGNGQQALVSVLTGLRQPSDGAIRLGPERAPAPRTPAGWTAARVGRIPEDRHGEGMIGDSPLWENAIVEDLNDPLRALGHDPRARRPRLRAGAGQAVRRAPPRWTYAPAACPAAICKADPGRTLAREPDFIVADQPTWGLDIGAVAYVREQCWRPAGAAPACCWCPRTWKRSSRWPTASPCCAAASWSTSSRSRTDAGQRGPGHDGNARLGPVTPRRALPTHHRANIRMKLLLERRPEPSRLALALAPVAAILFTLAVCALLVAWPARPSGAPMRCCSRAPSARASRCPRP